MRNLTFKMMLPLLLTGIFFTGVSEKATGQTQDDYDAFRALVGDEKYAALKDADPDDVALFVYMNRHGYEVSDAGEKDLSGYPDISEIEMLYPAAAAPTEENLTAGTWDMYGCHIVPDKTRLLRYRVGDTGMVLTILSEDLARKKITKEKRTAG